MYTAFCFALECIPSSKEEQVWVMYVRTFFSSIGISGNLHFLSFTLSNIHARARVPAQVYSAVERMGLTWTGRSLTHSSSNNQRKRNLLLQGDAWMSNNALSVNTKNRQETGVLLITRIYFHSFEWVWDSLGMDARQPDIEKTDRHQHVCMSRNYISRLFFFFTRLWHPSAVLFLEGK